MLLRYLPATHDLEDAYLQTEQVIYIRRNIPNGHYHHLNPINAVHKYGSLPFLIENEGIDNGIIYSCVEKNVLFVLVGSIRDDEPLPEVFPNVYQGQDAMRDCVRKTIIVIYCLCLGKGFSDGLNYYLNPDFRALGFKGVLAAMGQAFYSLSLGMWIIVSYGSYMGANIKVGKSVFMIALFDTIVALLAGLAIFPAIYHYQAETGVALQNNGIVMMFSSLPIVFNTLGAAGKIISFFFFGRSPLRRSPRSFLFWKW